MWIVCKDRAVNSNCIESICIQADKAGTHIVGYVANDPCETAITLGAYETFEIASARYQMLIYALEENRNVFRMP